MAHKNQTVTDVPQAHEAENSSVLRCLSKVSIEKPVLWRSLGKSFHQHTKRSLAKRAVAASYSTETTSE